MNELSENLQGSNRWQTERTLFRAAAMRLNGQFNEGKVHFVVANNCLIWMRIPLPGQCARIPRKNWSLVLRLSIPTALPRALRSLRTARRR